jgi:hypothetical protein
MIMKMMVASRGNLQLTWNPNHGNTFFFTSHSQSFNLVGYEEKSSPDSFGLEPGTPIPPGPLVEVFVKSAPKHRSYFVMSKGLGIFFIPLP